jgi:hypothetical protein
MNDTTMVVYPGPPAMALRAFDEALQSRTGSPVTMTWAGPDLVVLWKEPPTVTASLPVVAALGAAVLFAIAGFQMVTIEAEATFTTVDEVFYRAVGFLSFGLAALALAFGLRR